MDLAQFEINREELFVRVHKGFSFHKNKYIFGIYVIIQMYTNL